TISKRAARNALLPTVDLVANYGGTGLAGALNPNFTSTGTPPGATNGGYTDALTTTTSHPTYFAGFSMNIPIRNRAAQADQVRSELEFRQAEVRLQQLQNTIAIDVRNAQFSVQQNRAAVDAAMKAREFGAHMPHAPYTVRGNDVTTEPVPAFQPQQTGVTPQPKGQ